MATRPLILASVALVSMAGSFCGRPVSSTPLTSLPQGTAIPTVRPPTSTPRIPVTVQFNPTVSPTPSPIDLSPITPLNIDRLGKLLEFERYHSEWITPIAWSADSTTVVGAYNTGRVVSWDISRGAPEEFTVLPFASPRESIFAAFSHDAALLAIGSPGGQFAVWDLKTTSLRAVVPVPESDNRVIWAPQGDYLATYRVARPWEQVDLTVRAWNAHTGELLYKLVGPTAEILDLAFSPDDHFLAVASADNRVLVWDMRTGKLHIALVGHIADVTAIAWDPRGNWLASGGNDTTVRIWSYASGETLELLAPHQRFISSLAVSPDGKWLAAIDLNTYIHVWDTSSWQMKCAIDGDEWGKSSVFSWAPNSDFLLSANEPLGDRARIWDREVCSQAFEIPAVIVTWAPDGKKIATGGQRISIYGIED